MRPLQFEGEPKMLSLEDAIIFHPNQTYLPLSHADQEIAWQQVQQHPYSNPAARDRAFYNTLCLNILTPWFIEEFSLQNAPQPWLSELPTIWEFLNGTILNFPTFRIALMPSDTHPFEQLSVEQEWVDIPEWAVHYYLAIQINLEAGWLKIVGYTTHSQLKQAHHDALDQTYNLAATTLTEDLQTLWLAHRFFPQWLSNVESRFVQTDAIQSTPDFSLLYSPRLDLPFSQWAALISHPEQRRSLYQQRTAQTVTKIRLSQWADYLFEEGWQPVSEILQMPTYAIARGITQRAKLVLLDQTAIALVVSREANTPSEVGILLEARMIHPVPCPSDLVLSVAFQDQFGQGDWLEQSVSANAIDSSLQLPRLLGAPGEEFSVTVTLGASSFTEAFVI
jgi:Protein of unknown function (DUF1822)